MPDPISTMFVEFRASTSKFADDLAKMNADVKAFDRALKPISDRAKDIGKAFTAVGVPVAAFGAAAVNAALKIDEGLDDIRAGTGATGEAFQKLGTDFRTVLGRVPDSINTVSTAIADLNRRTSLIGEPLQKLAEQEINLARITHSEIGPTIAATTRLFGDWSVATKDQTSALDFMFRVTQQTGISFTRLNELVVQFGAPMRALGFSLEQSAALLGKWEKEGVNLETVLSGLRFALGNFAKAHQEPQAALQAVIEKIKSAKTESEATGIAFQVFGKRAAIDMGRAILEGRFDIDQLVTGLKNSNETINKASDDVKGFAEKFEQLKNKVMLAIEPIGVQLVGSFERMIPLAERLAQKVAVVADGFARMSPAAQDTAVKIGLVVVAIGPAILILEKVITIGGRIGLMIGALAGGFITAGAEIVAACQLIAGGEGIGAVLGALATGVTVPWWLTVGVFVGAAAAVYRLVTAYHDLKRAREDQEQAHVDEQLALFREIDTLKKHGVAIDTAGKSYEQLLPIVREAFKNYEAFKKITDETTKSTKEHGTQSGAAGAKVNELGGAARGAGIDVSALGGHTDKAKTAAQLYKDQVNELVKSLGKNTNEQMALADAIKIAESRHVSATEILKAYGTKLEEISQNHRRNGEAIEASLVPYVKLQERQESMQRVMKMMDDGINEQIDIFHDQAVALENAEQAWRQYQDTMSKLPLGTAEANRQFQTLLDLIDQVEARMRNSPFGQIPLAKLPEGMIKPPTVPIFDTTQRRTPDPDLEKMKRDREALEKAKNDIRNSAGAVFDQIFLRTKKSSDDNGEALIKLVEDLKKQGVQIDENTKKWYKYALAHREAANADLVALKKQVDEYAQQHRSALEKAFGTVKTALKGGTLSLGRTIFQDITAELFGPLKKAWDDVAKALGNAIKSALKPVTEWITSTLSDVVKHFAKSLASSVTESAAKSAVPSVSNLPKLPIPTPPPAAPPIPPPTVPSGGGGEGGGAEGAGASTGIIQAAVSAAGSLGVIFQLKRIEGTMNAVEHNTRYSMIHLGVMIDQLFWPWDGQIHFIASQQSEHTNQLDAIYNAIVANGVVRAVQPTGAKLVSSVTSTQLTQPTGTEYGAQLDAIYNAVTMSGKIGEYSDQLTAIYGAITASKTTVQPAAVTATIVNTGSLEQMNVSVRNAIDAINAKYKTLFAGSNKDIIKPAADEQNNVEQLSASIRGAVDAINARYKTLFAGSNRDIIKPVTDEHSDEYANQLNAIHDAIVTKFDALLSGDKSQAVQALGSANIRYTAAAVSNIAPAKTGGFTLQVAGPLVDVTAPIQAIQKIDRAAVRDEIMPEWLDAFKGGIADSRVRVTKIVKDSWDGV